MKLQKGFDPIVPVFCSLIFSLDCMYVAHMPPIIKTLFMQFATRSYAKPSLFWCAWVGRVLRGKKMRMSQNCPVCRSSHRSYPLLAKTINNYLCQHKTIL